MEAKAAPEQTSGRLNQQTSCKERIYGQLTGKGKKNFSKGAGIADQSAQNGRTARI
ncbi:hypothetical protein MASR1M12_08910 [Erysipelotrichia bacterium]